MTGTSSTATLPPGVRYTIQKPTTSHDDGTPSDSCFNDMQRVLRMVEDERHQVAHNLYHNVLERIQDMKMSSLASQQNPTTKQPRLRLRKSKAALQQEKQHQDEEEAHAIISNKKSILDDLDKRCALFSKAKENLLDDNNWTLAQTLFGITTFYRTEEDGSISIKMEGQLDGVSLFDQIAVLREVDLHCKWAPFCPSSMTIAHLEKLDTVGWMVVGLPTFGLMRDACFRAIGSDSMLEDGGILLVGQGIQDRPEGTSKDDATTEEFDFLSNDPVLDELDLPERPTRLGSGRMTLRTFQALVQVESPTSARTRLIANVNPNLPFVPQSLIDFVMKKLCGILLNKLQQAAKRIAKDPVYNVHACKMREDDFYMNWLLPKFQAVCKLRNWTMPPIASFNLTEQELELADAAVEKRRKGKKPKTLRKRHTMNDEKLDGVLEEIHSKSTQSAPATGGVHSARIRMKTDNSVVSDISRDSSSASSIWHSNPISNYLREIEEKTQDRKAREIERSRERARNRLKPKPLDDDAKHRLNELRRARTRQISKDSSESLQSDLSREMTPSMQKVDSELNRKDLATLLTSYGALMQISLILVLVGAFFLLLSLEPVLGGSVSLQSSGYKRSAFTLILILLSGLLHFAICYTTLIYAFSALQIGSIAGRQAKRFYSQNIHLILGISSSALVGFSLIKASLTSGLRWALWNASILIHWCSNRFYSLQDQSSNYSFIKFPSILSHAQTITTKSSTILVSGVSATLRSIRAALVDSNSVGRSIWNLVTLLSSGVCQGWNRIRMIVYSSIAFYEGDVTVPLWHEEAFVTNKYLLSYTCIFVLVSVLLFNTLARHSRYTPHNEEDDLADTEASSATTGASTLIDLQNRNGTMNAMNESSMPPLQLSMTVSPDSRTTTAQTKFQRSSSKIQKKNQSLSTNFQTIHEEEESADTHQSKDGFNGKHKKLLGTFQKDQKEASRTVSSF